MCYLTLARFPASHVCLVYVLMLSNFDNTLPASNVCLVCICPAYLMKRAHLSCAHRWLASTSTTFMWMCAASTRTTPRTTCTKSATRVILTLTGPGRWRMRSMFIHVRHRLRFTTLAIGCNTFPISVLRCGWPFLVQLASNFASL